MFNEQRRAGPGIDGRSDTPLTRLMDTGILERYGQPPRREVRFTTDEWLIYFAAEQFCQQAAEPTSTGAADVYIGLLRQARALPIIREITFVALALTIAVAKHDQITVLCQSADAALRALLREAAVAYGRDKPDEIRSVLLALLHTRAADQRDGILKRRSRVRSFVADVAQTLGMADIVRRAEHD